MADADITAARVRELLDYDPATGIFTRKVRLAQRHQVGDRADFIVTGGGLAGYYRGGIDSKRFLAHRLAWLYVNGEWPQQEIDHINGDPGDNRIANLRDVPARINAENKRGPRKDNACGQRGVMAHQGRWRARIQVDGQTMHIGMYDTPQEAHDAYIAAKLELHEGYAA
jgi:hypothetical protein